LIRINTPLTEKAAVSLNAGDLVELSGQIYAARDAAHSRLIEMLKRGEKLPFDIKDQVIYYVGPCPPPPGKICGSAGPTTSGRMDVYTPALLKIGLKGMIGKGIRDVSVKKAITEHKAVYFGATGGAGALISRCITAAEIVAFDDLGPEALLRITVSRFPLIVIIDSRGNDLYETGRKKYAGISCS